MSTITNKRTRQELRSIFSTGNVPTEEDFADIFESSLNLKDDNNIFEELKTKDDENSQSIKNLEAKEIEDFTSISQRVEEEAVRSTNQHTEAIDKINILEAKEIKDFTSISQRVEEEAVRSTNQHTEAIDKINILEAKEIKDFTSISQRVEEEAVRSTNQHTEAIDKINILEAKEIKDFTSISQRVEEEAVRSTNQHTEAIDKINILEAKEIKDFTSISQRVEEESVRSTNQYVEGINKINSLEAKEIKDFTSISQRVEQEAVRSTNQYVEGINKINSLEAKEIKDFTSVSQRVEQEAVRSTNQYVEVINKINGLGKPPNPTLADLGLNSSAYTINGITKDVKFYAPCDYATTTNLSITYMGNGPGATITNTARGILSIDGAAPALGSRILVKNQSDSATNGIYTVANTGSPTTSWVLTRATDYDQASKTMVGAMVQIVNGAANTGTTWVQTSSITNIGASNLLGLLGGSPVLFSSGRSDLAHNIFRTGNQTFDFSTNNDPISISWLGAINRTVRHDFMRKTSDSKMTGFRIASGLGTTADGSNTWFSMAAYQAVSPADGFKINLLYYNGQNNILYLDPQVVIGNGANGVNSATTLNNGVTVNGDATFNSMAYFKAALSLIPPSYGFLAPAGTIGFANNSKGLKASYSIKAEARILCYELNTFSSRKKKTVTGKGNEITTEATELFKSIPFSKYQFKDPILEGNGTYFGIVAEDLHEVIPEYVQTDNSAYVPNIYQKAQVRSLGNDKYSLTISKNLDTTIESKQLRVVIRKLDDSGETERFTEVEIIDYSQNTFTVVTTEKLPESVFVYGTFETCPSVNKMALAELAMVVLQEQLSREERQNAVIEQLVQKVEALGEEVERLKALQK